MKIKDHVITLATKKMAGEATSKELQDLNDLFEKDGALYEALQFLFSERNDNEQQPDDHSQLLFEKIKAKIKSQT